MLAIAAVAIGILGGCSDDADALDRPATERAVGRAVAAQVAPPVAGTACPGTLTRAKGRRFTCTIELGAGAGTLKVVVRQVDDQGSLDVTPSAAVLSDAAIARSLKALLKAQFDRSFQVDCGDRGDRVRPPGTTLTCTARDRTSRREVTVTITDAAGTQSFEVLPAAG